MLATLSDRIGKESVIEKEVEVSLAQCLEEK